MISVDLLVTGLILFCALAATEGVRQADLPQCTLSHKRPCGK